MSRKCQIVPALASAVHGVTDEFTALASESSFVESERTDSTSSSSQSSEPSTVPSSRTITQPMDARQAFAYFDKNHDGKITIKEFSSVMHDLGYKTVDKCFIRQIFAEANRSGNRNELSYEDFVEFLQSKSISADDVHRLELPSMSLEIEALFNCYDLDKNGYIEPKELRKVMKKLTGEKLSKEDIAAMINAADKNGDGILDKNEFAILCNAF